MQVPLLEFLECVEENVGRIHKYQLGASGDNGESDCIGLIIGALALAGFKWPGTHGTNWTVRNAMATFGPVLSANDLFLGELLFKAREPGDPRYSLPDSYKDNSDQRDYYHVGVVTSLTPLVITHCTDVDGGIKEDSSLGQWKWGGDLVYVDYSNIDYTEEEPLYRAIVTATSGNTVNLRSRPNLASSILRKIPIGTEVEVLDQHDSKWSEIRTDKGEVGFMVSAFLKDISLDAPIEEATEYLRKALAILESQNVDKV